MNITKKLLKNLYDQSPVPVYERRMVNWRGLYRRTPWYTGKRLWPHIVIDSSLLPYQKVTVLFHEIGHHYCSENSCICCRTNNDSLNEVHAMIFDLRQCLNYGFIRSYCWSIMTIIDIIKRPKLYESYYKDKLYPRAVKKLVRRKEWNRHLDTFEQLRYH